MVNACSTRGSVRSLHITECFVTCSPWVVMMGIIVGWSIDACNFVSSNRNCSCNWVDSFVAVCKPPWAVVNSHLNPVHSCSSFVNWSRSCVFSTSLRCTISFNCVACCFLSSSNWCFAFSNSSSFWVTFDDNAESWAWSLRIFSSEIVRSWWRASSTIAAIRCSSSPMTSATLRIRS